MFLQFYLIFKLILSKNIFQNKKPTSGYNKILSRDKFLNFTISYPFDMALQQP
nr:MAG TPA: hypothetical protein [Caudoviricetes sp.]